MKKGLFKSFLMLVTALAIMLSSTAALASSEISIPAIKQNTLDIDPIKQNTYAVEGAQFITWNGEISREDQKDTYTFCAPCDGRYRVDLSGMKNGTVVQLRIINENGEKIVEDNYCKNNQGITAMGLTAGSTYQVQVIQKEKYSTYQLTLGMAKPETDISTLTELTDSVEFADQRNVYVFTVPRDGRYRFELSRLRNGTVVEIMVFNDLGECVGQDNYCKNGDGVTMKGLEAGNTYQVQVRQKEGLSSYVLSIGQQKEDVDISDLTRLTDSVEFTDQRNVYWFTVPRDGRYRFELSRMKNGTVVEIMVFNDLGECISQDNYCKNGDGVTLKGLQAGETYEVQIRQKEGFCDYVMTIGQQKESVQVSRQTTIHDSVEYTDQRNVYYLTVNQDGSVTLKVAGMANGIVLDLVVFNDLGEEITSDHYFVNGDTLTVKGLSAGQTVQIQIRQKEKTGEYTLTID